MSKYKVGDIAALFPKSAKPKMNTGNKLHSLFDEYYRKSCKRSEKPKEMNPITTHEYKNNKRNLSGDETNRAENRSDPKKKRKYFDAHNSEDVTVTNSKKAKNAAESADEFASEIVSKKLVTNEETYFPRNKKRKSKHFNYVKAGTSLFSEMSENDASFAKDDLSPVNSEHQQVKKKEIKCQVEADVNSNSEVLQTHKKIKKTQLQDAKVDKSVVNYTVDRMLDKLAPTKSSLKKKQKKARKNKAVNGKAIENQETQNYTEDEKDKIQLQKTNNLSSTKNDFDQINESEGDTKICEKKEKFKKPKETTECLSHTLFVGNLPVDMTPQMLSKLFARFGSLKSCRLRGAVPPKASISKKIASIKNQFHTGQRSRIGFVVFKNEKDAAQALALNGTLYENHHIVVNQAPTFGEKKVYDPACSIFIGNLPFDVADDAIWSTFDECGPIQAIRLIRDRETGVGKGFGYVLFQNIQSKVKALALENVEIGDRKIRIKQVEKAYTNSKPTNQWSGVKRKAMKAKKQQDSRGMNSKSVKKLMKREKIIHKKKKIADIFKKFSV